MQNFNIVEQNINRYIKKFYLNELIKGGILFFTAFLVYFIITTALEYFLWLSSFGRAILFWSFIVFTLVLFVKFICIPLAKLFRWVKGIDYTVASQQIGKHFPEVSDKLLNLLQLKEQGGNDELVLAGIEQKSRELKPIPFQSAINLSNALRYAKYAIIPISIIILVLFFGKADLFSESYKRVVNYQTYYEPPAPFYFMLNNTDLNVNEGESLIINVTTTGELIPENARINYNGQSYFLRPLGNGQFTYTFDKISDDFTFNLSSNDIQSEDFNVAVTKVPKILDFTMVLDYPNYTNSTDKTVQGQGSINVPEGTKITWRLQTQSTDVVTYDSGSQTENFSRSEDLFSLEKQILNNTDYSISTSNDNIRNFETLNYKIKVLKDQYPKINVERKQDSSNVEISYFQVNLTDDYGVSSSRIVYYEKDNPKNKLTSNISISKSNFNQYYYTFPNEDLQLKEGKTYEYYFEVFDNDRINGRKSAQSQVFGYREKTQSEIENDLLNKQSKSIDSLNAGLENLKMQEKDLQEIEKLQKEKQNFNYSDKQKMANFIKRQKQQREMMKEYMKSLKESLEDFQPEENSEEKEALQERLKNNEKMLQQNEELLKELEKYQNKLEDEKLKEKLDKFSKSSKQQERSLEQLLELTKRYYVEQKAQKITEELNKLAEKQEDLSEKTDENESKSQDSLNKDFDKLKEDLDALQKENEKLKEPMELERDQLAEKQADNAQEEAQENLEKSESSDTPQSQKQQQQQNANKQQNKAAEQMKKMAQSMSSSMMSMSGQQQAEDAEMLRQILDNLITFSKEQEALMEDFKVLNSTNPNFAKKLRRQGQLRENFEHVDDSLFALALRNPMISDKILTKLTDIQYDIDQSIERLAETQIRLGTTSQQYVMVNANELSNMLDNSLDQMQMQMSGSGQGQSSGKGKGQSPGSGFQLSDIIKSHEELQKQMQGQGKKPGQQPGDSQGKGKSGKNSGQDGESGKKGENGKSGNQSGQQNGDSNNSRNGENGQQGKSGKDGNGGSNGDQGNENNERGLSNELSGELYEIFKQQQDLRNQLEDRIKELGIESDAGNLQKSLDQLEEDMLMQGFSSDVLKQMENVKHQLLKLEKAAQKQGQDSKREATTNYKNYQNKAVSDIKDKTKEYFESFEILNRQQLPLQTKYRNLIKQYFDESSN
jgi:hypothetical protein